MVLLQDDDETGDEHLMELKMSNARNLHPIVKALMFKETGVIDVSQNGLRIVVDDQNCLQAIAYIKNDLFSTFLLRDESVLFRIPIAILAECLSIFGLSSNTALKMVYDGYGKPLKIMLEKDGIVVKCGIKTLNPEEILDFDFNAVDVVTKLIMKPQKLKETFQELDYSSSVVGIKINRHSLYISTDGDLGKIQIEIPQHSEQVEKLECSKEINYRYRSSFIKRMMSSLAIADKISLRINHQGVLSVQFMIEQNENRIFIEFFCTPDADFEM